MFQLEKVERVRTKKGNDCLINIPYSDRILVELDGTACRSDKQFMKLVVHGKNHFEVAKNLPALFVPQDCPAGSMFHFTFKQIDETTYEIQKSDKIYADEWIFMEEVSSKIARREIYGFVSKINSYETVLGFSGMSFIAEYKFVNDQWVLRWFEDDNTRELSPAETRLAIQADFIKLKKSLVG